MSSSGRARPLPAPEAWATTSQPSAGMRVRRYPQWFEARGPGGAQVRLVPGGPASLTAPHPASGSSRQPAASRPSSKSPTQPPASSPSLPGEAKAVRERRARAARKYKPAKITTLLVAEAPPSAPERYFYFDDVHAHDSLFRNVAKAMLGSAPAGVDGIHLPLLWAAGEVDFDRYLRLVELSTSPHHVPPCGAIRCATVDAHESVQLQAAHRRRGSTTGALVVPRRDT